MKNSGWLRGVAGALALGALAPAMADTLLVERVEQAEVVSTPARGASMDQVLASYGEPQARAAPVGGDKPQHPPITRWVYASFTVYFEHDKVINSVVNRLTALEQGPKTPGG